jgi:hypothetical protein
LAIIVLTLNKFLWLKFEVFTGSPIHPPPSRCSQLDAAVAGPSAVLASSFEVEILPLASPPGAGSDLAEGGDGAEGGDEAEGAAPPPSDA